MAVVHTRFCGVFGDKTAPAALTSPAALAALAGCRRATLH